MSDKRYYYVDESGQDTQGDFFVVVVVLADNDIESFQQTCERFEKLSKKGKVKWREAKNTRLEYIRLVFQNSLFVGKITYSIYTVSQKYEDLTIRTITLAANYEEKESQRAIMIDGLPKEKWKEYGKRIRQCGVRVWKVRGVRLDENDPLIRLADAVCGCIRAAYFGQSEMKVLLERALQEGVIVNLLN